MNVIFLYEVLKMNEQRFEKLLYELLWLYYRADLNLSVELISIFVKCGFQKELDDFINEVGYVSERGMRD